MLERLLGGWKGKTVVLILLGFAATAFIITITLSAADATAHIIESPVVPTWIHGKDRVLVTLILLSLLSGVFSQRVQRSNRCRCSYRCHLFEFERICSLCGQPAFDGQSHVFENAWASLMNRYQSPGQMFLVSMLLFPKLALGLSGFETGVAVMPLVKGEPDDDAKRPRGRIRNSKKLLATAAIIMCFYLVFSSITTSTFNSARTFCRRRRS